MLDIRVKNSINENAIDNSYKFIDISLVNNSNYPLTFDAIFFGTPTKIGTEEFYKFFVRLNLLNNNYTNQKKYEAIKIIGDVSTTKFVITNSNGTHNLKTIENESQIKFTPCQIINSSGEICDKFYCLKIPTKYYDEGGTNLIKFQSNIHSENKNFAQSFYGALYLNTLHKISISNMSKNSYRIKNLNNVFGYFNYVPKRDCGKNVDLMSTYYDIQDESTISKNVFLEDYKIKKSNFLNDFSNYQIDEKTSSYLNLEKSGISSQLKNSIESSFYLKSDMNKLSDYYSIKKPINLLEQKNKSDFNVINKNHTRLNYSNNKVEEDDGKLKTGIIINPNITDELCFEDDMSFENFEFSILKSDVNSNSKIVKIFQTNNKSENLKLLLNIIIPINKFKNASIDYIRSYINEKNQNI